MLNFLGIDGQFAIEDRIRLAEAETLVAPARYAPRDIEERRPAESPTIRRRLASALVQLGVKLDPLAVEAVSQTAA